MPNIAFKEFYKALSTLLAVFVGAFFAFRLNEHREFRKTFLENKSALNQALFTIGRQANAIQVILKHLAKYETELDRAFVLPAYKSAEYQDLKQDFQQLSFILDSSNPQVLLELTIEQERFEQAMDAIRIRNEFYVHEIQPALSLHKLTGRNVSIAELKETMGERLFEGGIQGAQTLYKHIEACEKSLPKMQEKLFELAKKLFPKHRFIKFKPTIPASQTQSSS